MGWEKLLKKGQKLYFKDQWLPAKAVLAEACRLAPKQAGVLLHLAYVLNYLGERQEALDLLDRALEIEPENPAVYIILGLVEYDREDLAQAQNYWKKALEFEKDNPLAKSFLALGKIKADPKGAIKELISGELYPQTDFLARLLVEIEEAYA